MLLNRLTAAGLFLTATAGLGLTMAMNWRFGESFAIESDSYLSAGAYLIIDTMTALSALTLGQRVAVKAWTSTIVAGVALILFGTASMVSLIGFGSANRMAIAAAQKAEGEAIVGHYQDGLKARLAHAEWLRSQSVTADADKASRKTFLKESSDVINGIATMSAPKVDPKSILPDAQAAVLAKLAGVPVEKVQFALVAMLSALLIVAKATGMGFAGLLWSAKSVVPGAAVREHIGSPSVVGDEPGRGQRDIPELAKSGLASSSPNPAAADYSRPSNLAREERAGSSSIVIQMKPAPSSLQPGDAAPQQVEGGSAGSPFTERSHVPAFVHDRLRSTPGPSVGATDLRDAYIGWCTEHGYTPLSPQKLAAELAAMGFTKWKSCGRMRYRDLQLVA
jgi:hypothetical protein